MWHVIARLCARPAVGSRRPSRRSRTPGLDRLERRTLLSAGSFGLNVGIDPYSSFVNWLQVPGRWTALPGQSNTIPLNASNDPESDAVLLFDDRVNQFFDGPDPNAVGPNLSGTYHLAFNGQATIQNEFPGFSTPFTVKNQVYNAATNSTSADLVVPAGNSAEFFAIMFTNTQATATSPTNTGFSNASLIRPGYAAGSTQLYTNEFLAALAPYSVLRYLGADNANGQPYLDNNNALVTFNASQIDQTGLPWEYLVTLANETNTDMWINIPQGATDDYVTAVAEIMKNGGTVDGTYYPGLNPNLKIYLEYSNEVWGGIPGNLYYQEAAVQNSASNQPLSTFPGNADIYENSDGTTTTDVYTAVGRRYLERTAEIGQIFQSVLGADPTHQRLRPVLGWQETNYAYYPPALAWFEHFFGPASAAFYGMGNANYWSPTDYSSVASTLSTLQQQEATYAIPNTLDYTTLATFFGLKNVSYEGGPSIGAPGTNSDGSTDPEGQNALAASRDPAMEQLVDQHYVNYYADGGTLAMYFSGPTGIWSPENEWSAAELSQYGDPSASAKYRGTVDVGDAAPVAVTAGIQVTASAPTRFSATTDTLGEDFSQPNTGQQNYWLLNAASAGTYDLQLTTNANSGTAPGQVEVFLNDQQVGGVVNVSGSSTVNLGNLPLAAGLNTISLLVVQGTNPGQVNTDLHMFQPTTFTLTPAGSPLLSDAGFESPSVGPGNYRYDPTGTAWLYSGQAGVAANNSAFTGAAPVPDGGQAGFVQGTGSIAQVLTGWTAGTYQISVAAAQRYGTGIEDFQVLVDGQLVGTFTPSGITYAMDTTAAFTVTAGSHTITFQGIDSAGGDPSAFIDEVAVGVASTPTPTPTPTPTGAVLDPGFESPSSGNGNYQYDPTGTAWAYTGQAGVAANNSAFTGAAPVPEGMQAGFVQGTGSITQVIAGWTAGTYQISFAAAQRYGTGIEDFQVLVDGQLVGTFTPSGITYSMDTTATFTVTAGSHRITFQGIDSAGGDPSVFLDEVAITMAS